ARLSGWRRQDLSKYDFTPHRCRVVEVFLAAVSPISLQVATRVLDQVEQDLIVQRRQRALQLEQSRYEARLAHRQYDAVDPANRLVAAELERRWNEKLERGAQLGGPMPRQRGRLDGT